MNDVTRVLAIVSLGAVACREVPQATRRAPSADTTAGVVVVPAHAPTGNEIRLGVARTQSVARTITTTGSLAWDPASISDVDAPVSGRVLALRGTVGDRVAPGDTVAVIENPDNLDGRYTVRAVSGGVITERAASVGAVIERGGRLLRLVDDRRLWLLVTVPPAPGDRPGPGAPIDADIPATGARVTGIIGAMLPEADSVSHAALARVTIDNAHRALAAGMSALVRVRIGAAVNAAVVPRAAVVLVRGQPVVFVRAATGYRPLRVTLGPPLGADGVAIVSGIAGGDSVVVVGAQQLANAGFDFRSLGEDEDDDQP